MLMCAFGVKRRKMIAFIMFVLSTIGMCQIIVDGSIMEGFRLFFKRKTTQLGIPSFGKLVECQMCCGTWVGFLMGLIWISYNPFIIFACGCAGAFLCNTAAIILNWIEAATMNNLQDK